MAGDNVSILLQIMSDFKDAVADFKKLTTSVNNATEAIALNVKNVNALTVAMDRNMASIKRIQKDSAKLNKQRHQEVLTTKRLAQQETLLGAIYAKNSAIAQKKYLHSITGLRRGLARFNAETSRVMIMEKGHISMLDEQGNAMKRFMIKGNMVGRTLDNLSTKYLNLGKNLQWTGRQLMVGLTLPLAAISFGAVRSYMEWDRAITRTTKLLDDQVDASGKVTRSAKDISKALQEEATKMSTTFGVAREEIMGDTMAMFAQIGATEKEIKGSLNQPGLAQMAIEFNILGDLENPQKAGEMVRVLFQNYRSELQDTDAALKETQRTLSIFNTIEDQTSLNMEGIAESFPKIANTMRRMNVEAGEGIAFLTAMTQNGIDATEAANALRFALTKLPAAGAYLEDPSMRGESARRLKILTDAIERYNETAATADRIDLFDADTGKFKGADQAIMQIARAWTSMGDAQREVFNRAIAGSTQSERLGTLFENVGKAMSGDMQQDFAKAIALAQDGEFAASQWEKQMQEVLGADYVQWRNIINDLKNNFQELGKELSSVLLPIFGKISEWFKTAIDWFKGLDEGTKRWMVSLVALAAVIGPITYGLGQLVILSAQLVKAVFTKPLKGLFAFSNSLSDTGIQAEHLKTKVNGLFDSYSQGHISRNVLKEGIEEALAEQKLLEAQTRRTTGALREQGRVDVSPGPMGVTPGGRERANLMVAGAVHPQNQRLRFRDKIKSVIAGPAGAADLRPRVMGGSVASSNLPLEQLQRDFPDVLAEVINDQERLFASRGQAFPGIGELDLDEVRNRLEDRIFKQRVESKNLPRLSADFVRTGEKLSEVDELLNTVTRPDYLDDALRQADDIYNPQRFKNLTSELEAKKIYTNAFKDFLVTDTTVSASDVRNPVFMRRFFDDITTEVFKSWDGTEQSLRGLFIKAFDDLVYDVRDPSFYIPGHVERTGKTSLSEGVAPLRMRRFVETLNTKEVIGGRGIRDALGGVNLLPGNMATMFSRENKAEIERELKARGSTAKPLSFSRGLMSTPIKQNLEALDIDPVHQARRFQTGMMAVEGFTSENIQKLLRGKLSSAEIDDFMTPQMHDLISKRLFGGMSDTAMFNALQEILGEEDFNKIIPKKPVANKAAINKLVQEWEQKEENVKPIRIEGEPDEIFNERLEDWKERRTKFRNRLKRRATGAIDEDRALAQTQVKKTIRSMERKVLRERLDALGLSPADKKAIMRVWTETRRGSFSGAGLVAGQDDMDIIDPERDEARRIRTRRDSARALEKWSKDEISNIDKQLAEVKKEQQRAIGRFGAKRRKIRRELQQRTTRLMAERSMLTNQLAVAQHRVATEIGRGREVTMLRDPGTVSGQGVAGAVPLTDDVLRKERALMMGDPRFMDSRREMEDRVTRRANERIGRQLERQRRAGVTDRFDSQVRSRLAAQELDPRRRVGRGMTALFTGGLMGSFNGRSRQEDLEAQAMLMERNLGRGDIDAPISRRELRAQRQLIASADTEGGVIPPVLMPGAEGEGRGERAKRRARTGARAGRRTATATGAGLSRAATATGAGLKKAVTEPKAALKGIGKASKEAAKSGAKLTGKGGGALLNAATWMQPANAMKKFDGSAVKNTKTVGRLKDAFMGVKDAGTGKRGGGLFGVFNMLTMGLGGMGVQAGVSLAALGPLIPIFLGLAAVVLLVWKNWDKVSKGIGGGVKALGNAFGSIKDAVIGPFIDMFSQLNGEGEGMGDMWEGVGNIINVASHVIAKSLEFIAHPIRWVMELLAGLTRITIKLVQFLVALFTGDWKSMWEAARDIVGTFVSSVIGFLMEIPAAAIDAIALLIDGLEGVVGLLGKIPGMGFFADPIEDALGDVSNFMHGYADLVRDIPEIGGGFISGNKEAAEEAAEEEAVGYKKKWRMTPQPKTVGPDPNLDEARAAAEEENDEYVKSFVGAFQGQMRSVVDGWKDAAIKAYDDWVDAQQEALDTQIEGIRELTKTEEEELKKRDYLRRKEEMMNNMRSMANKHAIERDKLIYEGKYDEASELDTQYYMDRNDAEREAEEFEENHQRELLLAEREGQIESIEQQKEHNKEKFDLQREALQASLEEITKYIPKNAGEAEKMQQAILGAMEPYVGKFGGIAVRSQEAWRHSWRHAWKETNRQVEEDSFWSGANALKQFAKGLGLDESEIDGVIRSTGGGSLSDPTTFVPIGGAGGPIMTEEVENTIPKVGQMHTGGQVGNTSMAPSDVAATLQTGEYVIQRRTVSKYGKDFLDKLNEGQIGEDQVYHSGGLVGAAGAARKAFRKATQNAIGNFFGGGSIGGGLTWEAVQKAWTSALTGMTGLGAGFFSQEETPSEDISQWINGNVTGLNKGFVARFASYARALGRQLSITSGFRSYAQQVDLKKKKPHLAATPGSSWHEKGLAIDHAPRSIPSWRQLAEEKFGLYYPMASLTDSEPRRPGGLYEPWHVQPIETKGKRAREHELGEIPTSDDAGSPGGVALSSDIPRGLNRELFEGLRGLMGTMGAGIPEGTVTAGREEIKAIVRGMLSAFGWSDAQWPALDRLISGESSWNPNAANPVSSARGLFQKMTSLHGPLEPTIEGQAQWGLNYIKERYGNPSEAWRMWNSRNPHWYHGGGMVIPKFHEGNYRIAKTGLAEVAKGEKIRYGDQEFSGGDVHVHIGQFFGSDREIEKLGKEIDRVMSKHRRARGMEPRSFKSY